MLPSGRLSYNLFFADRLESNQRHMDYKSKDSVITAADYVLPSETIARWLLHDATVITASLLTMMLFRIVSGLWDEVTPHYVNWVVVLQGNHRKDLNRHPPRGTSTASGQLVMERSTSLLRHLLELRGQDSNLRTLGYEPRMIPLHHPVLKTGATIGQLTEASQILLRISGAK